jgi:CBS domain-containing protein
MKVASLYRRVAISCHPLDALDRVADAMWTHDIGCLPVADEGGKLVGMITDRDVAMAAFLQGAPLQRILVSSVMTKELVTCGVDDPASAAIARMAERQLRRLPVVDRDGQLIGILSVNDIARAATVGSLPLSEVALLIAAIGKPRPIATAA